MEKLRVVSEKSDRVMENPRQMMNNPGAVSDIPPLVMQNLPAVLKPIPLPKGQPILKISEALPISSLKGVELCLLIEKLRILSEKSDGVMENPRQMMNNPGAVSDIPPLVMQNLPAVLKPIPMPKGQPIFKISEALPINPLKGVELCLLIEKLHIVSEKSDRVMENPRPMMNNRSVVSYIPPEVMEKLPAVPKLILCPKASPSQNK